MEIKRSASPAMAVVVLVAVTMPACNIVLMKMNVTSSFTSPQHQDAFFTTVVPTLGLLPILELLLK